MQTTYIFLHNAAHLWDLHFERLREAKRIVLKDLQNVIQKNNKATQVLRISYNVISLYVYSSHFNCSLLCFRYCFLIQNVAILRCIIYLLNALNVKYYILLQSQEIKLNITLDTLRQAPDENKLEQALNEVNNILDTLKKT